MTILAAQLKHTYLSTVDEERYMRFISEFRNKDIELIKKYTTTIRQLFSVDDKIHAGPDNYIGSISCYTTGSYLDWLYCNNNWENAAIFYSLPTMIRGVLKVAPPQSWIYQIVWVVDAKGYIYSYDGYLG